jgi:hypothetical protein
MKQEAVYGAVPFGFAYHNGPLELPHYSPCGREEFSALANMTSRERFVKPV